MAPLQGKLKHKQHGSRDAQAEEEHGGKAALCRYRSSEDRAAVTLPCEMKSGKGRSRGRWPGNIRGDEDKSGSESESLDSTLALPCTS